MSDSEVVASLPAQLAEAVREANDASDRPYIIMQAFGCKNFVGVFAGCTKGEAKCLCHRVVKLTLAVADAEHAAALLAERERAWQPIETAPRDGAVVQVFGECQDWPMRGYGRWIQDVGWICRGYHGIQGDMTFGVPTHWQPLPAPPATAIRTGDPTPLATRFAALRELPDGWDSYGGLKPAEAALAVAEIIARNPPQIVPVATGGVQLEWHVNGVDIEIEVAPDGTLAAMDEPQ